MSAWRSKGGSSFSSQQRHTNGTVSTLPRPSEKNEETVASTSASASSAKEENKTTISTQSKTIFSLFQHYGIAVKNDITSSTSLISLEDIEKEEDCHNVNRTNSRLNLGETKGNKILLTKTISDTSDSSSSSSSGVNQGQGSSLSKVLVEYTEQVQQKHVTIGNLEKLEAEIKGNYVKGMDLFNKIIVVYNKISASGTLYGLRHEEEKKLNMEMYRGDEKKEEIEKNNYHQNIQDTIKYLEQVQILATYVPYFVRHKNKV